MVHIFTYIWTMISTSIIALYDGSEYYDGMYLPGWLKIILVLPVRKEKRIPKYIVVVHGIIQIFTVLWLAILKLFMKGVRRGISAGMFWQFCGMESICPIVWRSAKTQNMGGDTELPMHYKRVF